MTNNAADGSAPDLNVEALKRARNSPAVLKLQIARLRSALPDLPILAFEGDDDKIVYHHWLAKLRPDLVYASFPCGGKGKVLTLRQSLQRDRTGLNVGIYFFVDRDFDELRDQESGPDIFMTDTYSVENYLVSPSVLDKVLEIEFHCHASPNVRSAIRDRFLACYREFLDVTRIINKRLYIARQSKIEIEPITDRLGDIAEVNFERSRAGRLSDQDIINFRSDPDINQVAQFEREFEALDAERRYRGKFALMFFKKWIECLAAQKDEADRGVFRDSTSKAPFRTGELGLNCYASRSAFPADLEAFVKAIAMPGAVFQQGARREAAAD